MSDPTQDDLHIVRITSEAEDAFEGSEYTFATADLAHEYAAIRVAEGDEVEVYRPTILTALPARVQVFDVHHVVFLPKDYTSEDFDESWIQAPEVRSMWRDLVEDGISDRLVPVVGEEWSDDDPLDYRISIGFRVSGTDETLVRAMAQDFMVKLSARIDLLRANAPEPLTPEQTFDRMIQEVQAS